MKKPSKANILSFDTEEWFQAPILEKYIPTGEWDSTESRVEQEVDFILETLRTSDVKATFFLVGWVAERHPDMLKKIAGDGHEIGIHGHMHRNIHHQSPEAFREDLIRAIETVSGIIGEPVKGYRAPAYTITHATEWALDILKECGIEYDSSIYPISLHPDYGFPDLPCQPFRFKNGLYEFPMSTLKIGPMAVPFGSGAYLRLFPYAVTRSIMRYINNRDEIFTINIHPWELDPDHKPLKTIGRAERFRHYTNISINRKKFTNLLSQFRFCTFREFVKDYEFGTREV